MRLSPGAVPGPAPWQAVRVDHPVQISALERLGRFQARHARVVVGGWVALVLAAFLLALGGLGGGSLFSRLDSGPSLVPGQNRDGEKVLSQQSVQGNGVLVTVDGVDPTSTPVQQAVTDLVRRISTDPRVSAVTSPYTVPGGPTGPAGAALVSRDGQGVALVVQLRPRLSNPDQLEAASAIEAKAARAADGLPGARSATGSTPQLIHEITDQVERDMRTGEGVALPISLLVMVLVFGGFLAAGLPLAGAIAAIGGGLASLWVFSEFISLDATVVNVVTILGLGLCIDYGLLVVSRFREELRHAIGDSGPGSLPEADREHVVQAVGRTVAVAGRTVLFSGAIVAISLSGLMFFEASVLRAMGAAGMSVVLVALVVALGLVPALVALAGARLIRPGLPTRVPGLRSLLARLGDVAPPEGIFSRLGTWVQRHAWPVAAGVAAVLIVAAVPVTGLQLRSSGAELMPVGSGQRTFFQQLDERWPALAAPDIQVVTRGTVPAVRQWGEQVAQLPGVNQVRPPRQQGALVVLDVQVDGGDAAGPTAHAVVDRLRGEKPGFATWVLGQASAQSDFSDALHRRAPFAIGLVVIATFVLLFLMTGSVLIPIQALLLNVLSLGASLGVATWVFQDGHLEGLLGFTSTGGIETTIPPLVLAFGFGLSMDYEVFLLSRIKERRDAGLASNAAVVAGLQQSGRIITSAALLVVIVFAGLLMARVLAVQQTGVALTVAVALDATLVRMLLVPATMTLLGEWNWWAPAPLRRLHDRFGVGAH